MHYSWMQKSNIKDLLVINTCNRTELYAWTNDLDFLIDLLCKHSDGNRKLYDTVGYNYTGEKGISHLFRVGSGLESQILGDFEIIGQIKQSFYRSKNGASKWILRKINQFCYSV